MQYSANSLSATQPFQSQGLCFNQCKSQYAFAVVQGNNCWCSNYAPSQTTSLSSCSVACPGFPAEACGNAQAGLFGYIPTPLSPSGTIGSPGTISSPAASASTIMAVSTPSVGAPAESTLLSTLALSIVISTVLVKASSSLFESLVQSSSTSKILIPFEQTVTESPSPVTVLETVTASPAEQTVRISLVWELPFLAVSAGYILRSGGSIVNEDLKANTRAFSQLPQH